MRAPARRRRILHLIDTGGPGGAETVLATLVERLDRDRWDSVVAVPIRDWLHGALSERGVAPLLLPTQGSFDLLYLARIVQVVRRHRIDLIHTHLLTSAVYGSVAARACGIPVVCTFHGEADVSADESFRKIKFRLINRRSNRVVFVSAMLREAFLRVERLDAGRVRVVLNGIDPGRYAPDPDRSLRRDLGLSGDEIVVGAVGNVRRPKDYANLLRAAALLRERSPRYRFWIVGDTQGGGTLHDELLALRGELGLEEAVRFLGFRRDVPRVLSSMDVFALSSEREGLPLSILQAMSCGVPVVSTRCGGPEEVIRDGQNGTLVPRRDPLALAEAVHALAQDSAAAERLAWAGRQTLHESFTLDRMVRQYEEIYEESLTRAPTASPPGLAALGA